MASDLRQMQTQLYRHLLVAAAGSVALGFLVHQLAWGLAAALGFLASVVYFWMLGRQVEKFFALGRQPALFQIVGLLLGRQAVCVLACLLAIAAWGTAWWACLLALLVGRHWVMVVSARLHEAM